MGSAASVSSGREEEDRLEAVVVNANYALDSTKSGIEIAEKAVDANFEAVEKIVTDSNIPIDGDEFQKSFSEIQALIPADKKEEVSRIISAASGHLTANEINRAVKSIKDLLPNVNGDAILVGIAGSLETASNLAPKVIAGIGAVLYAVGPHLPLIGMAAGAIGMILYTFKASLDQDANIKNVLLWLNSLNDWIMLIASKVNASGVASTLPLFEGLKNALIKFAELIDSHSKKWRITKMVCSVSFQSDFDDTKVAVMDLKNALRDFLDEETQIKQEKSLSTITSIQLEINEKMASMEDQLTQIRSMLETQVSKVEAEKDHSVKDIEEQIYTSMQNAAGVTEDIPLKKFIIIFESFFFGGVDMPSEQNRGLRVVINKDYNAFVSKAEWIKFYRQWMNSKLDIETFLNQIASENPTVISQAKEKALQAVDIAKEALASRGIENIDDAKVVIAEKASAALSQLGNFGVSLLGSKKTEDKPKEL